MAWLILAHADAAQLDRLIGRLAPEGSPDVVIVHADAASPLWPLLRARWPADTDRVRLIRDPVAVRWGHWSQVAAIVRLAEAAVAAGCDYAHLLSGADWPLLDRDALAAELEADAARPCFVEAVAGEQEDRMQTFRFDARWLRSGDSRFAAATCWQLRRLSRWLDGLRRAAGLARSRPFGPWHKGGTWWSLPADVLPEVIAGAKRLLASGRLRGTVCCDEHVIPTIVAARFPNRLSGSRRFVQFPPGQSSPRLLRKSDRATALASGAWFMRKVSLAHDDFFLDLPAPCAKRGAGLRNAV